MPEFVVVGENDNGVLLGEWPKLSMSGGLTPLLTLKLLSLDSDANPDTHVLLIVVFSVEGKQSFPLN